MKLVNWPFLTGVELARYRFDAHFRHDGFHSIAADLDALQIELIQLLARFQTLGAQVNWRFSRSRSRRFIIYQSHCETVLNRSYTLPRRQPNAWPAEQSAT